MDILQFIQTGYLPYIFTLTDEQIASWAVLSPHIPEHLRINCFISSLALLNLVHRERAQVVSDTLHTTQGALAPGLFLPNTITREFTQDYYRDLVHDLEIDTTGIEYELIYNSFLAGTLILDNFQGLKEILRVNTATIIMGQYLSLDPPHGNLRNENGEIRGGHAFIMRKNAMGELQIIEAQFNPVRIYTGDQAIRDYFIHAGFTYYALLFKGRVIDRSREKIKKSHNSLKIKSKFTTKAKTISRKKDNFTEHNKKRRSETLSRKRTGRGRGRGRRNKF